VALKKAVEWDVIERMPCRIQLLPVPKSSASFHDFEQYERLVETSSPLDRQTELIVLLGGDAGLRCGEMIALEWRDVDLGKRQLCIERSDWNGQVTTTKGGRLRYIPLTLRLAAVLREHGTFAVRGYCATWTERRSRGRWCRRGSSGRPDGRTCATGFISFATRSVRTWRCVARRRGRFRNSPVIASSR
jgi:integrase